MGGRRQHRASRWARRWPPRWPTPAGRRTRLAARWQGPDPLPTTRRRNGRCPHHASTRAPVQPTFGCFSLSAHGNQWYPMPGRRQGARKTSMELPHAPTRRPIRCQPEKPSFHATIDRGATVKCAVRACRPPTQQPIGMLQTLAEGWLLAGVRLADGPCVCPRASGPPQALVSAGEACESVSQADPCRCPLAGGSLRAPVTAALPPRAPGRRLSGRPSERFTFPPLTGGKADGYGPEMARLTVMAGISPVMAAGTKIVVDNPRSRKSQEPRKAVKSATADILAIREP